MAQPCWPQPSRASVLDQPQEKEAGRSVQGQSCSRKSSNTQILRILSNNHSTPVNLERSQVSRQIWERIKWHQAILGRGPLRILGLCSLVKPTRSPHNLPSWMTAPFLGTSSGLGTGAPGQMTASRWSRTWPSCPGHGKVDIPLGCTVESPGPQKACLGPSSEPAVQSCGSQQVVVQCLSVFRCHEASHVPYSAQDRPHQRGV